MFVSIPSADVDFAPIDEFGAQSLELGDPVISHFNEHIFIERMHDLESTPRRARDIFAFLFVFRLEQANERAERRLLRAHRRAAGTRESINKNGALKPAALVQENLCVELQIRFECVELLPWVVSQFVV